MSFRINRLHRELTPDLIAAQYEISETEWKNRFECDVRMQIIAAATSFSSDILRELALYLPHFSDDVEGKHYISSFKAFVYCSVSLISIFESVYVRHAYVCEI